MTVIKSLFESKKFIVFLTGTLASVMVLFAGLPEEQAAQIAERIMVLTGMYVGAQGIADFGKGKEALRGDPSLAIADFGAILLERLVPAPAGPKPEEPKSEEPKSEEG